MRTSAPTTSSESTGLHKGLVSVPAGWCQSERGDVLGVKLRGAEIGMANLKLLVSVRTKILCRKAI